MRVLPGSLQIATHDGCRIGNASRDMPSTRIPERTLHLPRSWCGHAQRICDVLRAFLRLCTEDHAIRRPTPRCRLHFSAGNAHASNAIEDTPDSTPADTSATTATTLDRVPVIGAGGPHQVQRISEVDKQVLPPGTRGQKILKRLPGVSVQANDAFDATEESQTISVAASTSAWTSAGWATRWTASRGATPAMASTTA